MRKQVWEIGGSPCLKIDRYYLHNKLDFVSLSDVYWFTQEELGSDNPDLLNKASIVKEIYINASTAVELENCILLCTDVVNDNNIFISFGLNENNEIDILCGYDSSDGTIPLVSNGIIYQENVDKINLLLYANTYRFMMLLDNSDIVLKETWETKYKDIIDKIFKIKIKGA